MVGVKGNLKSAVERFNNSSNRKSVAKSLRNSGKVKSTKHIVAIDPITKQLVSGNISQIAKKLNTSPNTIKNRFKGRNKKETQIAVGNALGENLMNIDAAQVADSQFAL